MSEDHPRENADQPEPAAGPEQAPADPQASVDEPTQPLMGWGPQPSNPQPTSPPPGAQYPGAQYPGAQHPTAPYPTAPYAAHGAQLPTLAPARSASPDRGLPARTWLAVSALALVVGLTGGVLGAGLVDLADRDSGRVSSGLDGVATREAAPLDADNGSVPAVAQALLPSTVQIVADLDGQRSGATGSGFVLDREGHVVTNNHVVASAATDDGSIVVIDHTGVRRDASVVGRSPVYDLAVLLVDGLDAQPAALGKSRALLVGEPVVAFGSPLGLSQTVTSGIVSAVDRPVTTSGESGDDSSYINAVQTDAAINPGNSGGPLVNLAGEVVGVNSAIATTGGFSTDAGNIGVGFAIPIEQVRTTVDQILRTGKAQYPVIGATVRTGGQSGEAGALITEVNSGTPAAGAGLRKGDVVTAVAGQRVSDGIALIVAIRTHRPGDEVEFTVLRDGEEMSVALTLDGQDG